MNVVLALIAGYLLGQLRTEHRIAERLVRAEEERQLDVELVIPDHWTAEP